MYNGKRKAALFPGGIDQGKWKFTDRHCIHYWQRKKLFCIQISDFLFFKRWLYQVLSKAKNKKIIMFLSFASHTEIVKCLWLYVESYLPRQLGLFCDWNKKQLTKKFLLPWNWHSVHSHPLVKVIWFQYQGTQLINNCHKTLTTI